MNAGDLEDQPTAEFLKVAKTDEIETGQARVVNVNGEEIGLFNVDGQFFALDNVCTHEALPLPEGEISGHVLTCPWHGAKFDIRTGEVLGPPAYEALARYAVRVAGTDLEIEVRNAS